MNDRDVDEKFDVSLLRINKELNVFNGLWPYVPLKYKIVRRIIVLGVLIGVTLPHLLGIYRQCNGRGDFAICAENVAGLSYCTGVLTKYIVPIVSKRKVYRKICENWERIKDPVEKDIMLEYEKSGRLKSAFYLGYCIIAGLFFSQMTIIPVVMDFLIPLNQSRDKILVTNAKYPFDPFAYYYELYTLYCLISIVSVSVLVSTDSTYTVIIHQSLAIFGIVKHRLNKATEIEDRNVSFDTVVSAVKLHKQALEFVDLIESTYQKPFLVFIAATVVFLSLGSLIIVSHSDKLLDVIRMSLFEVGALIHVFFISWPGQLILQESEDLFLSTYANKWYNLSNKSTTLIKIIMLRTLKPCFLTAGGFYIMNFENFGSITKTSPSYVTVTCYHSVEIFCFKIVNQVRLVVLNLITLET